MTDAALPPPGAWRRLRRNPVALVSMLLLAAIIYLAIDAPRWIDYRPEALSTNQFSPPSKANPFGTDVNGRDVLSRVIQGARISLFVGLAGALISFFIGTAYGMISGYFGGRVDAVMMRFIEILYSIPRLILIIMAIYIFDPMLRNWLGALQLTFFLGNFRWALQGATLIPYSKIALLIIALGLIEWLTMARIVRGQVLSLKSQQFVLAARSLGQSHFRIIVRHLLPNIAGIVIIYLTLTIPAVILDESFLSFLGLGISAPQASWGTLLSDGAQVINPVKSYWWLLLFPAVVMSLTLLALNFLGDALRDALDPRSRR
ncbi:MAG TPA: ABC transporter permease [Chthoniobacteraceae bacterium]|jgi:peptide/nickel transport system permease protein/oligopeptide transport system permease protein